MTSTEQPVARKARIMVVDDHVVVREGLVALINKQLDLEVCAQAEGQTDALAKLDAARPDVVVVDLILRDGDGLELIKAIQARRPGQPVLVLSMQDEEVFAPRALRAGARGYLMKFEATERLFSALHVVLSGEVYVSPRMNALLLRQLVSHETRPGDVLGVETLSDRELEIYQLIGAGRQTREIAEQLGISAKTVESHRENIKQKLGLHNGVALIQSATEWLHHQARARRFPDPGRS